MRWLHRLAWHVREHVGAAGDLQYVVKKAGPAADVDLLERLGLATEHEKGARPRRFAHTFVNSVELRLKIVRDAVSLCLTRGDDAEVAQCPHDSRDPGVAIAEGAN